jgi:transcriptional regulator with XRE-family HTH domain
VDRLAELRESQGLTLRDLAERSGVDANTINQVELGHRKPRPSTLRKLAKALNVEVSDFFKEPAVPLAEAPGEARPPSPEWASAASDEEYANWIGAASSPDLHKVWISLSKIAEGMEEGPELRTYADRVQKAVDQFVKLGGGIESWKVSETREKATPKGKKTREAS